MSTPTAMAVTILGAGRVGSALARMALAAGHEVTVATRAAVEDLASMLEFVAPGAVARTAAEAVEAAELVVLAVPLSSYRQLPVESLRGRVVIDAMNYWPPVDGTIDEFEATSSSSEVVQRTLPAARVVKSLNHIGYAEVENQARPPGAPDRRALVVAGDDDEARAIAARFVESLGYDTVELPSLADGRVLQPGGELFGARFDRDVAISHLAASSRR